MRGGVAVAALESGKRTFNSVAEVIALT